MTKRFVKSMFIASAAASLAACGGTPNCDDGSVTKKLSETYLKLMKDASAGAATGGALGMLDSLEHGNGYENLKKQAESNAELKKVLVEIDKTMDQVKFDFSDIRSTHIDDKIKKSVCQAQVKISGPNGNQTQQFKYSAQSTGDGLVIELID